MIITPYKIVIRVRQCCGLVMNMLELKTLAMKPICLKFRQIRLEMCLYKRILGRKMAFILFAALKIDSIFPIFGP